MCVGVQGWSVTASDVSTQEGEGSGPSDGEASCNVDRRSKRSTKEGGHTGRDPSSGQPRSSGNERDLECGGVECPPFPFDGGTYRGGQPRGSVPLLKYIARRGSLPVHSHPLRGRSYLRTLGGAVDSPIRTSSSKPFPFPFHRDLSFQDHTIFFVNRRDLDGRSRAGGNEPGSVRVSGVGSEPAATGPQNTSKRIACCCTRIAIDASVARETCADHVGQEGAVPKQKRATKRLQTCSQNEGSYHWSRKYKHLRDKTRTQVLPSKTGTRIQTKYAFAEKRYRRILAKHWTSDAAAKRQNIEPQGKHPQVLHSGHE